MDKGFYLALGVTLLLPFLQYALPIMPKSVAWAGVAAGILVMLVEFLAPDMKPSLPVVLLFLIGTLCFGWAGHLYFQQPSSPRVAEKPTMAGEPPTPDPPTVLVDEVSKLSNLQLKRRAISLATNIRVFENGYESNNQRLQDDHWDALMRARREPEEEKKRKTMDDLHRAWQRQNDELRNQVYAEFMNRFYAEARTIRNELRKRLGLFPPFAYDIRTGLLDKRLFAGIRPMTGEADYIEELARQLPD
jgi:hypothetical protein